MASTLHTAESAETAATKGRTVAVSGASGLVGRALTELLEDDHFQVRSLIRSGTVTDVGQLPWDPQQGVVNPAHLEGLEAVVHLAGENIASGRWNSAKKHRIRASRVEPTRRLAEQLAELETPPRVLVCASAIGYYGDRGDIELDESARAGEGFLPSVCEEWEAATQPAAEAGIRVVNLRIGVVLSTHGGALKEMLTPFRFGMGGRVGSGRQFWSWIWLHDLVRTIEHCISNSEIRGPVNAVAPQAVTNAEFTKTLGRVLHRPTLVPLPGPAARLVLGEMATDLLLASAHVVPRRLQETGFEFTCPDLESALRAELH